jgi:hypothetical protein
MLSINLIDNGSAELDNGSSTWRHFSSLFAFTAIAVVVEAAQSHPPLPIEESTRNTIRVL